MSDKEKWKVRLGQYRPILSAKEQDISDRISSLLEQAGAINKESGREKLVALLGEINQCVFDSKCLKSDVGDVHRIALDKIDQRFERRLDPLYEEKYRLYKLLDTNLGQMKLV